MTRARHTPALQRSLVLAGLLGVVSLVAGRGDLLVFMAPFAVHVAWAFLSRPAATTPTAVTPRTVTVPEGESVPLLVRDERLARGTVMTVQWPHAEGVLMDPAGGTVLDVGREISVVAEPDRWGRYRLGPATVSLGDASGAWRSSLTSGQVTVTCRPASTTLEGGSGVAHPIGMVGAHRSRSRGGGTDLADVREFRAGDPLRRINWRVTSRMGSLHVNQALVEQDTDVLVVTDTLLDVLPADPDAQTSLDATVRAVAAISRHYVSFGDRVAIHDLGSRIGPVRSGSGPRQARVVLNVLSRANREVSDWDRLRPVPRLASGTLVFFCSPLLETEACNELVRLRRLGGEVIGVDTLPEGIGRFQDIGTFRRNTFLGEAWLIRRMQRDDVVARLRDVGVPVVPWRGVASLASVLLAMEAARSAPRRVVGR